MTGPEMRARRCPWGIAALWVWEATLALVVAWPAAALTREAFGADPRGDAVLWDGGGHPLLVLLTREAHGLAAMASGAAWVLVLATIAGVVPLAALMAAIARGAARPAGLAGVPRTGARALRCTAAFAILLGATLLAQGAMAGIAVFVGKVAGASTETSLGEARAHLLGALVTGVALLPVLALGMAQDLARAAVVLARVRAGRAVVLGVRAFWRLPGALSWAWAWRALVGVTLIAAGAAVAGALAPGGTYALVALALVHQGVILGRVALRASWLARALRAMAARPSL